MIDTTDINKTNPIQDKTTDPIDNQPEQENDEDILTKVLKFRNDGITGNQDWEDRGITAQNFKNGKQWDEVDLEELKKQRRPALTINYVLPKVNFVCGVERQNRKQIRVRPVKNATETVAKILTSLTSHTFNRSNGEYEKSEFFKDGIITGKGWIKFSISYDEDPINGNIVIERVDPFDVIEDPLAKEYDLNKSARYVIHEKWVNKEQLEAEYPDKKDTLSSSGILSRDSQILTKVYGDDRTSGRDDDGSELNINEYRYRVSECYWITYEKRTHWFDKVEFTDKVLVNADDIEKATIATQSASDRFSMSEKVDKVLNLTIFCGNTLLSHTKDPFKSKTNQYSVGINLYPISRFSPYFDNGYVYGIVDNLITPQQEINKRRSQSLHLLNSTANGGWMVQKGSLDQQTKDDLTRGANPLVIEFDNQPPIKIQPNMLSQGHILSSQEASTDMDMISGINPANQGVFQSQESGKLNELRQRQGMVISEIVFDNFDYSMQIFSNALIELIRSSDVYSKEEIELIVEDADLVDADLMAQAAKTVPPLPSLDELLNKMPTLANPQMMDDNDKVLLKDTVIKYQKAQAQYQTELETIAKQLVMKEISNLNKGRYTVVVSDSPNSPTQRMANFSDLLQLAQMYPMVIPPSVVIEASDVSNKEEIVNQIKQQQEMQAQMAQQQAQQQAQQMNQVQQYRQQQPIQ